MTRTGQELLLGNVVLQVNSAARTDTAAADGEVHVYTSGANIVLSIFNKTAGAWKSVTLS
jgi:hypothetical protein